MPYKQYSTETLTKAVEAINSKAMGLNAAAKAFGIPRATLSDKIHGKTPMQPARKTVLSVEEESLLEEWLISMARRGTGIMKGDLKVAVKRVLDADPITRANPRFKDNRPGDTWFRGFMSRHPNLKQRRTSVLDCPRAGVSEKKILS